MPSSRHQALIEIFKHRPSLAAELLTEALGHHLPAYDDASVVSADLTDLTPTEFRADAVITLTDAGSSVSAIVVEVQLRRDADKLWTWPVYLATLRARHRCPTVLLVVCVETGVAAWCAAPIDLGHPGWTLRPVVLGPERVPVVTDAEHAERAPELAVLSAMAHVRHPDWTKVADALIRALDALGTVQLARANDYTDVVLAALPAAARATLEAIMTASTREYQSDFARRYYFQGRAVGEASAVLAVLDARGIKVPDEARERITNSTDLEQLDAWVRRAATATSVDELFA